VIHTDSLTDFSTLLEVCCGVDKFCQLHTAFKVGQPARVIDSSQRVAAAVFSGRFFLTRESC